MRSEPAGSARSATAVRMVPDTRPAIGATPTALSPFFSRCTPTWSIGCVERLGGRAVDQRALEVLGLENFAEFLDAPVLDQELQPRLGPQPAVAVVAEDRGDRLPDVGHLVERHPGADPLGQHRVGRQAAADPQVQPGAVLGMVDADERDVVDLVHDVLQTRDRGLVLARQVGVLRVADVAARRSRRSPGWGRAPRRATRRPAASPAPRGGSRRTPRWSAARPRPAAARSRGRSRPRSSGTARSRGRRCRRCRGRTRWRSRPAVRSAAADSAPPSQRTRIMKYLASSMSVFSSPVQRAVVALLALGVQAPPAETAAQVALVDAVEAAAGVDVLDARPHVERVVVLLDLLVGVERLAVAQRPLALAAGAWRVGRWSSEVSLLREDRRRRTAQFTGGCPAAQIRRPAESAGGHGSTTSRQTATAANALEIDMPPRHQRNARAGLGGGHGAIVPWMPTGAATRSNLAHGD